MNILYFHRTQAKGVEGVHIGEIVKAWRRLGHVVRVISPVGDRTGDGSNKNAARGASGLQGRALSFISSKVPEILFEIAEILYNLVSLFQANRQGKQRVDVVFERYAIFAFAGAIFAYFTNSRLIMEVNYTSRSELVRKRSRLLAPLAHWVDSRVFARAFTLVAVSTNLKTHLINEFCIAPERIIVLPNAADPEVFNMEKVSPPEAYIGSRGKTIGFVGGFYPWHGLELLLKAFQIVEAQVPEANLMLIGDGPMMPAIREMCVRMKLVEKVTLTGHIPHTELPRFLTLFHIGVMPDSNDYGSPMKIFEYMSLGKPVVVPDYGPLLDAIEDGEQGMVFPARNVSKLAECLVALLTDEERYQRMSAAARKKIVTKHNWMSNAQSILATLPESLK